MYLTIFITLILSLICTSQGVLNAILCEGQSSLLECQNGEPIKIISAIYGQPRSEQVDPCPSAFGHANCRLDVLSQFTEICDGKTTCEVTAGNAYGDPCGGRPKYLDIYYECEVPEDYPMCSKEHGAALIPRSLTDVDAVTVINIGNPIKCHGYVTGWRWLAATSGEITALIFRQRGKKSSKQSFHIIHRTVLLAQNEDTVHEYILNEVDYIPVINGDIIGIHYSNGVLEYDNETEGSPSSEYLQGTDSFTSDDLVKNAKFLFDSTVVWRSYSFQVLMKDPETHNFQIYNPFWKQMTIGVDEQKVFMNDWKTFPSKGMVVGWRYVAKYTGGNLNALILRPVNVKESQFFIVGMTQISLSVADMEIVHMLNYEQQIPILPGDRIGFQTTEGKLYGSDSTYDAEANYLVSETDSIDVGSTIEFTELAFKYTAFDSVSIGERDPVNTVKSNKMINNFKLNQPVFDTLSSVSRTACVARCNAVEQCKSLNYKHDDRTCQLNEGTKDTHSDQFSQEDGQMYIEVEQTLQISYSKCSYVDCGDNRKCEPSDNIKGYVCRCMSTGYVADYCPLNECSLTLGMESGKILNEQITASSTFPCTACKPGCARLNQQEQSLHLVENCPSGWLVDTNRVNEWLKIDLLVEHKITGVITQGRDLQAADHWVQLYTISYFKLDEIGDTYITDGNGKIAMFSGNRNINGKSSHYFRQTIRGTAVKFNVKKWNNHISLRVEILGCKTENQWTRVFKGVSRNGYSIYEAWNTGEGSSSYHAHRFLLSNTHYRNNAIINNWSSFTIQQVKLTLYSAFQKEILKILFNGTGSTKHSWFTRDNLLESPWEDLKTAERNNIFSIIGDRTGRNFYINSYFANCPGDSGWLLVEETAICKGWEGYDANPVILYSKSKTTQVWENGNIGAAHTMTIDVELG